MTVARAGQPRAPAPEAVFPSLEAGHNVLCAGAASIVGGEDGLGCTSVGDFGGEHDRARGSALIVVVSGRRILGGEVAAANSSRDNTPSTIPHSPYSSRDNTPFVKISSLGWAYDAAGAVATVRAATMEVTVGIAAGAVAEVDTTIWPVGGGGVTVTHGVASLTVAPGGCSVGVELTVARFGRERVRTCTVAPGGGGGVGERNCAGCVAPSGTSCCNGCCTQTTGVCTGMV